MRVLVSGRISEDVIFRLKEEHTVEVHGEDRPMERQKLLDSICEKEGLLCMISDRIDTELLEKAGCLRMIANYAVGYDNIDLQAATARGIPVSNTPGVLTDSVADLTFALILATARRVVEGDKRNREGKFQFWAPLLFLGSEVSGKTLGIVGLGNIGRAVARRARGFNMRILYYNRRRLEKSEEISLGVEYLDIKTLLAESDFVSLHVPLTKQTRHLVGRKELEKMKRTGYLINASRGPVVHEEALVTALREGWIAGAGLDVYENEPSLASGLKELENAVLLPHLGSATQETRFRMASKAAENLLSGLKGKKPPNCLNWEDLSRSRSRS